MSKFQIGWIVGALLFVETGGEYIYATNISNDTVRFLGLGAMQFMNAGLIVYFYMHIYRLWREEAH